MDSFGDCLLRATRSSTVTGAWDTGRSVLVNVGGGAGFVALAVFSGVNALMMADFKLSTDCP